MADLLPSVTPLRVLFPSHHSNYHVITLGNVIYTCIINYIYSS